VVPRCNQRDCRGNSPLNGGGHRCVARANQAERRYGLAHIATQPQQSPGERVAEHLRMQQRFDQANGTHDGHPTEAQAKAG
jgi:hypothetical protein